MEGFHEGLAGPGLGEDTAEFLRELPPRAAADPVQGTGGTFAGADGQGHEFGDARKLRHHPRLPFLDVRAQQVVPEQEPADGAAHDGHDGDERAEAADRTGERHDADGEDESAGRPEELLSPEVHGCFGAAGAGEPAV
ncbi:hypothetical protein SRABI128_04750 [Microbacterium sp. Bi128]|nr:hypothetical protein SRABI128_04750 [Microbacterium sp. Bi128]